MTLYEEVLATGGYIANHESDLYIEINDTNREILKRHPLQSGNKTMFTNQVTGKPCWDVPFAYDPWWSHRLDGAKALAEDTLHQAIAKRGWTSRKEGDDQRRTIYDASGQPLGSFDAAEAWAFLRSQEEA